MDATDLGVCRLAQYISICDMISLYDLYAYFVLFSDSLERCDQHQLNEIERCGIRKLVRCTDHSYGLVSKVRVILCGGVLHDL